MEYYREVCGVLVELGESVLVNEENKRQAERNLSVVKSNALIQKSRYNLTTTEQKIILYLITKIHPSDERLTTYSFKVTEFREICGIESNGGRFYAELKATVKNLADKSIWIRMDNGKETLLRWIERPFIDERSGTIEIKIDEFMRPYLLHLQSHFTRYDLYYILAMRSQYSIRLYEIAKSYENLRTITVDIEELKKSIFAEKYDRWNDFHRFVIQSSVKEINQYSDITLSYQPIKDGRRFVKIKFDFEAKTNIEDRLMTWTNIEGKLGGRQKRKG
jgi:plasmid replication initiation protein